VLVCLACGRENPPESQFCNACGSPLEDAPARSREERKVVSVLFCDLVGFTSRAERLDPEDVRAMLSPYYARLRTELEQLGGTVEKFIGDAVMAVFGAPVAHEDDPERAVRAALRIRDAVVEAEDDLQVRIGITTGEALVALGARPREGEGMASGDVINTAARLQAGAPINGILVDETTYRATAQVIDFRARDSIEAKGKAEPVPVWEAVEARSRLGVDVRQYGLAALVGRTRELQLLHDAFARVREDRSPQLVTLVGVPGIGKSRLVYEFFVQDVESVPELIYWRQGRSLPYGQGVSFWALAEIAKAHAGILESDPAEQAAAKLGRAVRETITDQVEAAWVEGHLRPLVGIETEAEWAGDRRSEAFAAWRRLFEALAERVPAVLVFEDLHWADDGLLDFVDYLAEWASGVPLLLVATARPELLARRSGWGGGKANATTISLPPLSDEETAHLLALLLERAVLPAETQQALLARAGGNPLYAEQYARMLAERGRDVELAVPENVQGIIAARLDGLSSEEKELLQSASVVGKIFWGGVLARVGGQSPFAIEELMHRLERKEFVRRERRSSVAGENEYAFRHVLVRDVAYGQIPRGQRAEKHRLAAEWIESLAADRSEDRAEMLAHHYLSALEYARATGAATEDLSERARVALREAGDRASGLNAFAAAARFYSSALELWPSGDSGRPSLLFAYGVARFHSEGGGADTVSEARDALLEAGDAALAAEAEILLGDLEWNAARRDRAFAHLERASELVAELPATRSKAFVLSQLSRFLMLAGEHAEAIRVGREALAMAEELGLDELQAHALNNIGCALDWSGDPAGITYLERSVAVSEAINSPEMIRGYGNLSWVLSQRGDLSRYAELQARALALAERFGLANEVRWFRSTKVETGYWSGRWDQALTLVDELIADAEQGALRYLEAPWRTMRGRMRLARGDLAGARDDSEKAVDLAQLAKDPQILAPTLLFRAHVLIAGDDVNAAGELVRQHAVVQPAEQMLMSTAQSVDLPVVVVATGRTDEFMRAVGRLRFAGPWIDAAVAFVEGELNRAAEIYATIGTRPDEAYARLRAAEQLVVEGRRAEADEHLQKALAFYRSVGATRYIREGEALFAATA
jgi:class 3 adenylate cyclase/tetratricopeptide (TPR) repeat protein